MRRIWLLVGLSVLVVGLVAGAWWVWWYEPLLWEEVVGSGVEKEGACKADVGVISEQCRRGDWVYTRIEYTPLFCDFTKPVRVTGVHVLCQYLGYERIQR